MDIYGRGAGKVLAKLRSGPPACAKVAHWEPCEMKDQYRFGSANHVGSRKVEQISGLISDLDRLVRILTIGIATEEGHARLSDPSDAAYPILARTYAARRVNLKGTIASLQRQLADRGGRTEQAVPA